MSESGAELSDYQGTGEDLSPEQREYLATYMPHEPEDTGDRVAEVGPGDLADDGEQEWA